MKHKITDENQISFSEDKSSPSPFTKTHRQEILFENECIGELYTYDRGLWNPLTERYSICISATEENLENYPHDGYTENGKMWAEFSDLNRFINCYNDQIGVETMELFA